MYLGKKGNKMKSSVEHCMYRNYLDEWKKLSTMAKFWIWRSNHIIVIMECLLYCNILYVLYKLSCQKIHSFKICEQNGELLYFHHYIARRRRTIVPVRPSCGHHHNTRHHGKQIWLNFRRLPELSCFEVVKLSSGMSVGGMLYVGLWWCGELEPEWW